MTTILIIGTCDTKADELLFMRDCIEALGAKTLMVDVGVLGKPRFAPDYSNDQVAAMVGHTIAEVASAGDENDAMKLMSAGAAALTVKLYAEGRVDGLISLGGTMGTDLALEAASALPLGVPKFVVSTIAYSHLLPPERMPPDLMMILWAGGLYGLNSVCKATLSQACGAVVGAARAVVKPDLSRPLIGMTSLGSSCLKYMVYLKPELEARGYETAVFHCTGMGGQAFETLAAQKRFVAVFDLCLQEIENERLGTVVTAGPHRLKAAGAAGIPQIVAPGATDMIDIQSWRPLPAGFEDRAYHVHNRLLGSLATSAEERRALAAHVAERLAAAKGPVGFILPLGGIEAWDREGEPMHNPDGLANLIAGFRDTIRPPVETVEIDAHINDPAFATAAMAMFDAWVARGLIPPGRPAAA